MLGFAVHSFDLSIFDGVLSCVTRPRAKVMNHFRRINRNDVLCGLKNQLSYFVSLNNLKKF